MSFKRFDAEDFVVSSDSITSTLWSTGAPTLTQFFTSSVQEAGSSGRFLFSCLPNFFYSNCCYTTIWDNLCWFSRKW